MGRTWYGTTIPPTVPYHTNCVVVRETYGMLPYQLTRKMYVSLVTRIAYKFVGKAAGGRGLHSQAFRFCFCMLTTFLPLRWSRSRVIFCTSFATQMLSKINFFSYLHLTWRQRTSRRGLPRYFHFFVFRHPSYP